VGLRSYAIKSKNPLRAGFFAVGAATLALICARGWFFYTQGIQIYSALARFAAYIDKRIAASTYFGLGDEA
jgi:hypothetical protein